MKFPFTTRATVLAALLALSAAVFGQTADAQKAEAKPDAKPAGAPKIAIAKTQHDFGELKKGVMAQYDFKFKNEGTTELTINNVAPS